VTVLDDIAPSTVKIGMLGTAEIAELVGEYLPTLPSSVLDPVMVATSGDRLLTPDGEDAVRRLVPLADLITPNLSEAAVLLRTEPATSVSAAAEHARGLLDLGAKRVLVKGGHLDDAATDVYAEPGRLVRLESARVRTLNTHGTGCTLSSAIAALRPVSSTWEDAVAGAKEYLTGALRAADTLDVGHGHGPVHHFFDIWERA
jgi:hydroxymethylpyrimidine/phosphomethylpyrimidine kinase